MSLGFLYFLESLASCISWQRIRCLEIIYFLAWIFCQNLNSRSFFGMISNTLTLRNMVIYQILCNSSCLGSCHILGTWNRPCAISCLSTWPPPQDIQSWNTWHTFWNPFSFLRPLPKNPKLWLKNNWILIVNKTGFQETLYKAMLPPYLEHIYDRCTQMSHPSRNVFPI